MTFENEDTRRDVYYERSSQVIAFRWSNDKTKWPYWIEAMHHNGAILTDAKGNFHMAFGSSLKEMNEELWVTRDCNENVSVYGSHHFTTCYKYKTPEEAHFVNAVSYAVTSMGTT